MSRPVVKMRRLVPGDEEDSAYDVEVRGAQAGRVAQMHSTYHHRVGRLRTGRSSKTVWWIAMTTGGLHVDDSGHLRAVRYSAKREAPMHRTRRDAVKALVAHHLGD